MFRLMNSEEKKKKRGRKKKIKKTYITIEIE